MIRLATIIPKLYTLLKSGTGNKRTNVTWLLINFDCSAFSSQYLFSQWYNNVQSQNTLALICTTSSDWLGATVIWMS
jgi:hypothetical protein